MLTPKDAWQATLGQLQLQLNRATFDTWLKGSEVVAHEDGEFIVHVRHAYAKDWLEKHLKAQIIQTLGAISQRSVAVNFVVNLPVAPNTTEETGPLFASASAAQKTSPNGAKPAAAPDQAKPDATAPAPEKPVNNQPVAEKSSEKDPPPQAQLAAPNPAKFSEWDPRVTDVKGTPSRATAPHPDTPFNRLFTFDRFVTGPSNQFAFAAAKAVAETPGEQYNPLVIYGGVGLGKTHLLHAIGHVAHAQGKRAVYLTAEEFTNELVTAIKTHKTDVMRARYRTVDVLLLDDIQFLAGKTSSEEEFYHTFNTLLSQGKQIVIASNQHPRQLKNMDDRIRSRLCGGLLADIQAPEVKTRLAILKTKSTARGTALPDEVAGVLARHAADNVRELEGLLTQVLARAALTGQPLTVTLAEQVVNKNSPQPINHHRAPEIADVLQATATYHQLSLDDLLSKRRTKDVVRARQIAMYLAREETSASLPQIGAALGGRNHSTVLYGYRKIAKSVETDSALREEVSAIRRQLSLTPHV